jgi:hypothetical protein
VNGSRSGVDPLPTGADGLLCSARDCRQPASFDLQWNNPRIHPADRRKHWLACAAHRESLAAFLSARSFLRDVEPLAAPDEPHPASAADDQPLASPTKAAES